MIPISKFNFNNLLIIISSRKFCDKENNNSNSQRLSFRAVVRGGAGGALASPEFGVSEKRTERERDSLLLSAPSDLKT